VTELEEPKRFRVLVLEVSWTLPVLSVMLPGQRHAFLAAPRLNLEDKYEKSPRIVKPERNYHWCTGLPLIMLLAVGRGTIRIKTW